MLLADLYCLNIGSSGIIINSLKSITGNPIRNINLPRLNINYIRKEGLNVNNGFNINYIPPNGETKYTLCIVFHHWRNRNFSISKKNFNNNVLLHLY